MLTKTCLLGEFVVRVCPTFMLNKLIWLILVIKGMHLTCLNMLKFALNLKNTISQWIQMAILWFQIAKNICFPNTIWPLNPCLFSRVFTMETYKLNSLTIGKLCLIDSLRILMFSVTTLSMSHSLQTCIQIPHWYMNQEDLTEWLFNPSIKTFSNKLITQ